MNVIPRTRRWRVTLIVVALLVLLIVLWDWNWFKRPIEKRVEQETGRSFHIDGDLGVKLGLKPRIVLNGVRFGNTDWARTPEMFETERAEFTIDALELISGNLVFPNVTLVAPRIDIETLSASKKNWELADQPDKPEKKDAADSGKGLPQIGSLRVDRGELVYYDAVEKTDILLKIELRSRQDAEALQANATGKFRNLPLKVDATGGPVLSLTDTSAPYPFDGKFSIGGTRGSVGGTVTGLQAFTAAKLKVDVSGESLGDLHALTALVLPDTPPYRIAGDLEKDGDRWTFNDFSGKVGDSDLSGDVTVTYVKERPNFVADLKSKNLDFDDLAGFVGAPPQTGKGETASTEQKAEVKEVKAGGRALPDKPVDLAALRSMDADVKFEGMAIKNKDTVVEGLNFHLLLDKGMLKLRPLNFGIAGGDIRSEVEIDARKDALAMHADAKFMRLDLAKLMPTNSAITSASGLIGGHADVKGRGKSTAELLATLDGELGVAMRDGQFSNLLLEGVGLDAAEALRFLVSGDKKIRLRCAVVDLKATDGVLTPNAFVVDTTDTNIHVEGSVNLRDEKLDLSVHPLPKDFSPLSLRSPLHVRGTFMDPAFGIDRKLVIRGGAAAVLGALVNPLAALLPLIETGPGKNADCDALIAAASSKGGGTGTIPEAPAAK